MKKSTNIKFDNDAFYNKIKNYRDELRIYRLKSFMDFSIFKSTVSIPINLSAILMSSMEMNFKDEIIDPNYVLEQIKFILSNFPKFLIFKTVISSILFKTRLSKTSKSILSRMITW